MNTTTMIPFMHVSCFGEVTVKVSLYFDRQHASRLAMAHTKLALPPPPAPAAPVPEPAPGLKTAVFIPGVEQEVILTSVLNRPWRLGFAARVPWVPRLRLFPFTFGFVLHVLFYV